MPQTESPTPRIFISYSWTTPEHEEWVLELAQRLVNDGVDVVIDKWDLKQGQDKYVFMESMVQDPTISKVLMLCDEAYATKANERRGGVGDEALIITAQIYGQAVQEKFLPIVVERDGTGKELLPHFLKSRIYIDLSDKLTFEENYADLLRVVFGKPLYKKPPIGKPPRFITEDDDRPLQPTTFKLKAFESAILNSKGIAVGLANDYLHALEAAFDPITVPLAQKVVTNTQDIILQLESTIDGFLEMRNEFIDFITIVSKYGSDPRLFEATQQFFLRVTKYMFLQYKNNSGQVFADNYTFLIPELFLYAIATMIKHGRFEETNILLGAAYHDTQNNGNAVSGDYRIFMSYTEHLTQWKRTPSGIVSTPYDSYPLELLKNRATHSTITYQDLLDTDFVLFVRSLLHPAPSLFRNTWYPRTFRDAVYHYNYRSYPLFERATSRNDFKKLAYLLNVTDKQELIRRYESALQNKEIPDIEAFSSQGTEIHKRLMNLNRLDTL